MDYFPIFLSLKNKPCLVVGGGAIAVRKIELLIKADADITVIAPEITAAVTALQNRYSIKIQQRRFANEDAKKYITADDINKMLNQESYFKHVNYTFKRVFE